MICGNCESSVKASKGRQIVESDWYWDWDWNGVGGWGGIGWDTMVLDAKLMRTIGARFDESAMKGINIHTLTSMSTL